MPESSATDAAKYTTPRDMIIMNVRDDCGGAGLKGSQIGPARQAVMV